MNTCRLAWDSFSLKDDNKEKIIEREELQKERDTSLLETEQQSQMKKSFGILSFMWEIIEILSG